MIQPSYVTLSFGYADGETGTLVLDATLEEATELTSQVTKYAVEEGASESDNITTADEELNVSGVIVGAGASIYGAQGRRKLMAAKDALRMLGQNRRPITIVSGMDVYDSMGMSRATITRSGSSEQIAVNLTFVKIVMAMAQETDVPEEKAKGTKGTGAKGKAGATKSSGGTKQAGSADPSPKEQSLLRKMTKGGASVSAASIVGM